MPIFYVAHRRAVAPTDSWRSSRSEGDNVNRPEILEPSREPQLLLLLAAAPAAHAANDPLASGTTTLKLDAGVAQGAQGRAAVKRRPRAQAYIPDHRRLARRRARGTIDHSGGLRFSAGGKSLDRSSSFTVKLGKSLDAERDASARPASRS